MPSEREGFIELCNRFSSDDIQFITGLILADRKRILDEVEKPLRSVREQQTDELWKVAIGYMPTLAAIDETLSKIAELRGLNEN